MTKYKTSLRLRLFVVAAITFCLIAATGPAEAEEMFFNYDDLSLLEAPLATEIGDVTLVLIGMVDGAWALDLENDDDTDESFDGAFQVGAQTQLPNRWRIRLNYFGTYATDPEASPDSGFASRVDKEYEDDLALSVRGAWGAVVGGNVTDIVREQTRRTPGAGRASLSFDDVFGSLDGWAGGYVGRFGPWVLSAVVDEDGDFDLGATYQRPIGDKDYRLTTRYTEGAFTSADGSRRFDTRAVSGVGEFIYGSALFDLGVGYELLSSSGMDIEQWYVSSGVRIKIGAVSLSVEGHYGVVEGEEKTSAALGVQYDLARGLSANFGLNYEHARVNLGGVNLIASKGTKAVFSLRYSF